MLTYLVLKYLHVVGAAVLLGTGAGIAFFMLLAHRTGTPASSPAVARMVVDRRHRVHRDAPWSSSRSPAPLLALHVGYALTEGWIVLSIILYLVTGAFWLPVVWMQVQHARPAAKAVRRRRAAARRVSPAVRCWLAFGFPAFGAVLAIFWLMIAKP